MKITYTEKDGYLYPDLMVEEDSERVIGVWGMRHKRYLQNHRKIRYYGMLTSGKLAEYLADVDEQAQEMFETIVNQTKEARGITETMKAEDPQGWIREMNSIANMAEDFINRELIFR